MCRYDFLGKDTDTKPEQVNGSAAPGKSSEERRHREHKSSRDRDGTRDRHRDRDSHKEREDPDRRDKHRSSSRDHRSHKSSRHRDERDHRSSRDRDRPRDDPRDRHREDPRGQDAYKRPRMQEFVPRPAPPRYVWHCGHDMQAVCDRCGCDTDIVCSSIESCCILAKVLAYAIQAVACSAAGSQKLVMLFANSTLACRVRL